MSITVTNISNKITQIGKTPEIDIHRDNLCVIVLSGQGESLAIVTPYQQCILSKKKRKENTSQFGSNIGTNRRCSQPQKI